MHAVACACVKWHQAQEVVCLNTVPSRVYLKAFTSVRRLVCIGKDQILIEISSSSICSRVMLCCVGKENPLKKGRPFFGGFAFFCFFFRKAALQTQESIKGEGLANRFLFFWLVLFGKKQSPKKAASSAKNHIPFLPQLGVLSSPFFTLFLSPCGA